MEGQFNTGFSVISNNFREEEHQDLKILEDSSRLHYHEIDQRKFHKRHVISKKLRNILDKPQFHLNLRNGTQTGMTGITGMNGMNKAYHSKFVPMHQNKSSRHNRDIIGDAHRTIKQNSVMLMSRNSKNFKDPYQTTQPKKITHEYMNRNSGSNEKKSLTLQNTRSAINFKNMTKLVEPVSVKEKRSRNQMKHATTVLRLPKVSMLKTFNKLPKIKSNSRSPSITQGNSIN
jgi:hypothetical protein